MEQDLICWFYFVEFGYGLTSSGFVPGRQVNGAVEPVAQTGCDGVSNTLVSAGNLQEKYLLEGHNFIILSLTYNSYFDCSHGSVGAQNKTN